MENSTQPFLNEDQLRLLTAVLIDRMDAVSHIVKTMNNSKEEYSIKNRYDEEYEELHNLYKHIRTWKPY